MFSGLESPAHLLIVLLIAMLVLGPKRLPQVGRSLGSGIRQFRSSISGQGEEEEASSEKPMLPTTGEGVESGSASVDEAVAQNPTHGREAKAPRA